MVTDVNSPPQQPAIDFGHLDCPIFKNFSAEVRLVIYNEALSGSQLNLMLTKGRNSQGELLRGGGRSIFRSTGHHNLLLTCHAVYEEALP